MNRGVALEDLMCPDCLAVGALRRSGGNLQRVVCGACETEYPVRNEAPVLIQASNELFDPAYYEKPTSGGIYRKRRLRLPSPSVNLAQARVLRNLGRRLSLPTGARVLILGSGQQRMAVAEALGVEHDARVRLICCDIDVTADVDVFCDAHRLPFPEKYFDAVVTTAVLEHVLYPEQVAGEISRIVRTGGWVYSELPFLQQVHEGAYDFTRYTLSGHRRLLHGFQEIEAGAVAGPATALVWSLEHFFAALFGYGRLGTLARAVSRLGFFWIKYFDYAITTKKAASDAASCTYFYGERVERTVSDLEIVRAYEGARAISHT